jgi:hypothetical protein
MTRLKKRSRSEEETIAEDYLKVTLPFPLGKTDAECDGLHSWIEA